MLFDPAHRQIGRFTTDSAMHLNRSVHEYDLALEYIDAIVNKLEKEEVAVFEGKFKVQPVDGAPPP
jgi:hypothetical protein